MSMTMFRATKTTMHAAGSNCKEGTHALPVHLQYISVNGMELASFSNIGANPTTLVACFDEVMTQL